MTRATINAALVDEEGLASDSSAVAGTPDPDAADPAKGDEGIQKQLAGGKPVQPPNVPHPPPAAKEAVSQHQFDGMEKVMRSRFQATMRAATLALGFLVAVVMQVNALRLVHDLSIDSDLRAKAIGLGEQALDNGPPAPPAKTGSAFTTVVERSLLQLAEEFPEDAAAMEPVSGVALTVDDAVAELRAELNGHPREDRIVARYEELLRKGAGESIEDAKDRGEKVLSDLAVIDIQPWGEGWAFYYRGEDEASAPEGGEEPDRMAVVQPRGSVLNGRVPLVRSTLLVRAAAPSRQPQRCGRGRPKARRAW